MKEIDPQKNFCSKYIKTVPRAYKSLNQALGTGVAYVPPCQLRIREPMTRLLWQQPKQNSNLRVNM
jgi:hypothetical protein